jgi:hypothetical protein
LKEAQRQYHAEVERIKAAGSTPQIEALTKLTVDLSLENQKLRSKIDSL